MTLLLVGKGLVEMTFNKHRGQNWVLSVYVCGQIANGTSPPHLQEAKGREPPSMSCGHKINMVVRHAQARLESSRNVALIFF